MADPEALGPIQGEGGVRASVLPAPPMTGEKPFAKALIKRVWRQRLGDMTEEEARAEGFDSLEAFLDQFRLINGRKLKGDLTNTQVYAVEFQVLKKLA